MKISIPDHIIDEIRDRTDIVTVISDHVVLKKVGKNFKGLCPFHSEKTPSFSVSPDKRIYHCFGCGVGGNVFKFLMEIQSISFPEVLKVLAERAGIPLPRNSSDHSTDPGHKERESLRKLNEAATRYFQSLLKNPEGGLSARNYLTSRHFDAETLERYRVGWAAPTWKGLLTHVQQKSSVTQEQLLKSGLIIKKEDSSTVYDRFRGRVIFPIKDLHSNIIGFGGRSINEEDQPKYLNSPETLLYQKSETLFGMDQAKQAIRKENQVILVEGYFDQMRAVQHGVEYVVATCGTALTAKQASMLRNHAETAILIFDSDSAGRSAAEKGFDILLEHGMNVKIVVLPDGQDPDSFIQEQGAESFLEKIRNAKPFMESYIDALVRESPGQTPADKVKMANQILPLLAKIKNTVERSAWLEKFTSKTNIDDRTFLKELSKALTQNQPRMAETKSELAPLLNLEKHLVHLILSDKETAQMVLLEVDPEDFSDPILKNIAQTCRQKIDNDEDLRIDQLLGQTEDPETRNVLSRLGLESVEFESPERTMKDCIGKFKNIHLKSKIKDLKLQRLDAAKAGQVERSQELQAQLRKMHLALTH
ncbi:MAG: DNA primase [Nitrospinaceae bacterium]|nr:DNA primase [Nitrospinaceae bacterium]